MENNMESDTLLVQMHKKKRENGKTERERDGILIHLLDF